MKRDSVSEAQRTVFCKIPVSWPEYASARPAKAGGIAPRRTTTNPAVTPIMQTTESTNRLMNFPYTIYSGVLVLHTSDEIQPDGQPSHTANEQEKDGRVLVKQVHKSVNQT